jgi:hypothetical protein
MKIDPSRLKEFLVSEKSVPAALFIVCVLSYGLLIPQLGYYMDDWPYVFYAFNKGISSLNEMLLYDSRPYAGWLYTLAFKFLGFRPAAWHISSLVMHWATSVLIWLLFRKIWEGRKKEAVFISLLFATYPFFMLQPFAVGSTHHWFGFLTFTVSLLLMVWSIKLDRYKAAILTVISMALDVTQLFTSEYFAGLEFIRPVILLIIISRTEGNLPKRFIKVFGQWLPYLVSLGMYTYWRAVIYQNPLGIMRNQPILLKLFVNEPLQAINFLFTSSLKDSLSILTVGWQKATDVNLINFSSTFTLLGLGVSFLTFILFRFYLGRLSPDSNKTGDNWKAGSIALGITALLSAGLPIWLVGRTFFDSNNQLSASRFGLPATFGAALLTYVIIENLITNRIKKIILLSFLLALAVNFHIQNTKIFQYSWEKQLRFSEQLLWRAPNIEANTAILTDEEVLGVMGDYAVSFSINTTYQPGNIDRPAYWYFPFYYSYPDINQLIQGIPLEADKLTMHFDGNSRNMILLSFNPEMKRCLWVLQPQDENLRLVSEDMRRLSVGSNIGLIRESETTVPTLPESIYGKLDNKGWCYYFEKADLARQYQNWEEIIDLWQEAQIKGEHADNGFEYIPFIEGFGHTDDWEQVQFLAKSANKITPGLEPSLCTMVDRLTATTHRSDSRNNTLDTLKNIFKCSQYQ